MLKLCNGAQREKNEMACIYNADIFCDECGEAIRAEIIANDPSWADVSDESTYDSDEFPKYADNDAETDSPQHCGAHAECLDPTILSDGSAVGQLIGTNLTDDGVEYVREAIADGGLVAELWAEEFSDYDGIEAPEDDDDTEPRALAPYGCEQCVAVMVNGIFCHETGCPNSHLDSSGNRYDEPSAFWAGYDEDGE